MKKLYISIAIACILMNSGCDKAYPPVIANKTHHAISVHQKYLNETRENSLTSGTILCLCMNPEYDWDQQELVLTMPDGSSADLKQVGRDLFAHAYFIVTDTQVKAYDLRMKPTFRDGELKEDASTLAAVIPLGKGNAEPPASPRTRSPERRGEP